MGMDGLSIANTGVVKESTSAEYTNKVEQSIQADPTNSSRQVQGVNTNSRRVREREEGEENQKKKEQKDEQEEVFEDGLTEEEPEIEEAPLIEDIENPNKDFYVKLNAKDDIIELYDSATNRLIETIPETNSGNWYKN